MFENYPSANVVAAAIVAACKETKGSPEDVVRGVKGYTLSTTPASRARAYAAVALRAVCEGCSAPSISRMCGSKSNNSFLSGLDYRLRYRNLRWWSDDVFMRVVEATEAAVAKEQTARLTTKL